MDARMIARMQHSPVTADLALMRELNQTLILNLVRQEGYISHAEIAKRTSLSRSTVSNIINQLIESKHVHEVEKGQSRGGRRPILLKLNYSSHCVIGVELATTFVNLVVIDLKAEVLYQQCEPFDIAAGPDVATRHVAAMVAHALVAVGVARTTRLVGGRSDTCRRSSCQLVELA
jgi:DNA-binding Lrp family transcriptional regulator